MTACSLVLGLRDGEVGGGADGSTDAIADGGSDVDPNPLKDVVTVDVDNATCGDAARDYDPTAIHVDPVNGNDGSQCGGPGAGEPCATFKQGLLRIGQTGKKKLYLAAGDYKEQVTLTPGYNGLTIEGGWDPGWKSNCKSSLAQLVDPRSNTPGQSPTLHIKDATNITLRLFTITSRNQGGVGESVSALWVTTSGSANQVTVDNMTLIARFGGDGMLGANAGPAFGTNCFDGGSGAPGGPGLVGGDGVWSTNGFAPATAGPGDFGATGTAGAAGTPGGSGSCVSCGSYPTCSSNPFVMDGNPGQNGCAGNGGFGGSGGGGGGPTAALFVWGSKVDVVGGTTFATVQGGNGGAGGSGSAGTAGAAGSDGPPTSCTASCTPVAFDGGFDGGFCSTTSITIDGGKGGAPGGNGGKGGQGGGGKGGGAYLVVYGNGGTVNVPGAILTQSTNGAPGNGGASNGVTGEKTNVKVVP